MFTYFSTEMIENNEVSTELRQGLVELVSFESSEPEHFSSTAGERPASIYLARLWL